MTIPPEPLATPPSSIGSRLLFWALGLLALGVGTIITLGAALAGALSIGVAAWMAARKGKTLGRRGAWLAGVAGTIAVLVALMSVVMAMDKTTTKPMSRAERAEQREQVQQAMPEWMRRMNPSAGRETAAADSMAERLLQNRTVVVWAGLMGAVIASTMIGTIAGSFAWGGVMLFYRGWRGYWLGSGPVAS